MKRSITKREGEETQTKKMQQSMHTFKCLAVLMSIVMAIVASPAMASDEPQGVVAPDEVEFCLTRPEIQAEVVDRKDVFYNLPGVAAEEEGIGYL